MLLFKIKDFSGAENTGYGKMSDQVAVMRRKIPCGYGSTKQVLVPTKQLLSLKTLIEV